MAAAAAAVTKERERERERQKQGGVMPRRLHGLCTMLQEEGEDKREDEGT